MVAGTNTYGYVAGNPTGFIDPYGLEAIAVPTPGGFPSPGAHPVFTPGTAANDAFVNSTMSIINMMTSGDSDSSVESDSSNSCENTCSDYSEVYELNPKHKYKRTTGRGGVVIARRPSNGYQALINSVYVSERRKVGYDVVNSELVVLPMHRIDQQRCTKYFHGFVIDYMSDLKGRKDIVDAIRDAGYPFPPN